MLAHSSFDNNAARQRGGAIYFRAPTLPYSLAKQAVPRGEEQLFAVVPPGTATLLSCSLRNNMAIGSATEAAFGGAIFFDGSGARIEMAASRACFASSPLRHPLGLHSRHNDRRLPACAACCWLCAGAASIERSDIVMNSVMGPGGSTHSYGPLFWPLPDCAGLNFFHALPGCAALIYTCPEFDAHPDSRASLPLSHCRSACCGHANVVLLSACAAFCFSADAEGGSFGMRDGGVLYVRDSLVANNSAAYGAVLRLHSHRAGEMSVLFNNITIVNNTALRYGGIVSGYSHTHAIVAPFTFAGGRYYYDVDSYTFLARPLLRFGFNADPYLDPKAANIAPAGTGITANNPYEPGWHTLELPDDPHLTDQWPFFATGQRHQGYLDVRTTQGQKAASGGVALLLQDSNPRAFSTPDKEALTGVVAFKDCNIYDNAPVGLSCCYYHADLASQRCLSDTELL